MPAILQRARSAGESARHRVGVRLLHREVRRAARAARAERIAVERVVGARARLARDLLRRASCSASSRGRPRARARGARARTRPAMSPAEACACVRLRRDHGADDRRCRSGARSSRTRRDPRRACAGARASPRSRRGCRRRARAGGAGRPRRSRGRSQPPRDSRATSASRMAATAASALRGSCHQCGSKRDASRPSLSPARRTGTSAPRSITLRRAAGVRDDGAHPGVEPVAVHEHELGPGHGLDVGRPRLVLVRIGVGLQDLVHVGGVAGDGARPVADLRRRRDDLGAGVPLRRAAAAAGEDEREQHRRPRQQPRARATPARRAATAARARRARRRAPRPSAPAACSARPRARVRRCPARRRAPPTASSPDAEPLRPEPHGRGGDDEQRGREQRADRRQRRDDRERDEHEQHGVGHLRAQAHRAGRRRDRTPERASAARARASPATAAALAAPASTRSRVSVSRRLPKSSESTLPAEWKTSLASTTPPASAATSTSAVRLS